MCSSVKVSTKISHAMVARGVGVERHLVLQCGSEVKLERSHPPRRCRGWARGEITSIRDDACFFVR